MPINFLVYLSDEYPNIDNYSDEQELLTKWENYSLSDSRSNIVGCHVLVAGGLDRGMAEHPTTTGSWNESRDAVVAYDLPSKNAAMKNLVVHEVLHNYIDQSNEDVKGMYEDQEHDLGTVFSGPLGDGPVTPLGTSYVGSHARHGDCDSSATWNKTYTTELTECTRKALKATVSNVRNIIKMIEKTTTLRQLIGDGS